MNLIQETAPGVEFDEAGPNSLQRVGDQLYFNVRVHNTSYEAWTSDGTQAGTRKIYESPSKAVMTVDEVDSTLLLEVCDSMSDCDIWESDGTAEGTVEIPTSDPRRTLMSYQVAQPYGGFKHMFVTLSEEAINEVGTAPQQLYPIGQGDFFFQHGSRYWAIGADGPAQLIGSNLQLVDWHPDHTVFTQRTGRSFENHFFVFDHTTKSLSYRGETLASNRASNPTELTPIGDELFFVMNDRVMRMGEDGNASSTGIRVPAGLSPKKLAAVGSKLIVLSENRVDVLDTETNKISRLGNGFSYPALQEPIQVVSTDDGVYYVDITSRPFFEVRFTDGTEDGTRTLVSPELAAYRADAAAPTLLNEDLLLVNGHLLADLAQGEFRRSEAFYEDDSSRFAREVALDWLAFGDEHYAIMQQLSNRRFLRRWDTNLENSTDLMELPILNGQNERNQFEYAPGQPRIFELDGDVYFTDGLRGLYTSDGTPRGTRLVKRFEFIGSSLKKIGDKVFFTADDGEHGIELWLTDGTVDGTILAADVRPGPGGSEPADLAIWNNRLVFSADDGQVGRELWRIQLDVIGDIDGDLSVGFSDFLVLQQNFGSSTQAGSSSGDLNEDGEVNFTDFLLLAQAISDFA